MNKRKSKFKFKPDECNHKFEEPKYERCVNPRGDNLKTEKCSLCGWVKYKFY